MHGAAWMDARMAAAGAVKMLETVSFAGWLVGKLEEFESFSSLRDCNNQTNKTTTTKSIAEKAKEEEL